MTRRPLSLFACTLLLGASSLLAGCDEGSPSSPTPSQGLNTPFIIAPGENVAVRDASLQIYFDRVVTDARCPGDALCISAGEATLAFQVRVSSSGGTGYQMKTADPGRMLQVNGYNIELVELTPYPFASLPPIAPGAYRATLQVSRR